MSAKTSGRVTWTNNNTCMLKAHKQVLVVKFPFCMAAMFIINDKSFNISEF